MLEVGSFNHIVYLYMIQVFTIDQDKAPDEGSMVANGIPVSAPAECWNLVETIETFSKYITRDLIRPVYHILKNFRHHLFLCLSVIFKLLLLSP